MKKLWMGFAAYALILSSCSQQEVFDNIDRNNSQLQFSMAMGTQTKAAELTNTGLKATGGATKNDDKAIKLYAYQELSSDTWSKWYDSNLWWATPLGTSIEQWNISSVHFANVVPTKYYTYYPQQDKNNVKIVYTPKDGDITSTTPTLTYTASTTVANQVDLVGGVTSVAANGTQVQIKMRHLLSQVNFGVYGYAGANIEIGTITIKGVKTGGTYTFKGSDDYPLGTWGTNTSVGTYSYKESSNTAKELSNTAPASATTGHKYIFGDGGKWAVGPTSTSVWYWDAGKSGGPGWNNPENITDANKLSNSLMLIPQELIGATVEFQYRISDVNEGYTAGSAKGWADGKFSLDFKTVGTSGTDYLGKWEENYRYVYMIDFTDWLDGRVQTFSVDVDSQPWENYNNGGTGDGIVDIAALGQTTIAAINQQAKGSTYYMASKSITSPTDDQIAQLITTATWDWTNYDFKKLANTGDKIQIDFDKVIFNGKTLTINVPAGFTIYESTETIAAKQQATTIDVTTPIAVTIAKAVTVAAPTSVSLNALVNNINWYVAKSDGADPTTTAYVHLTANVTWDWSNGATYTFAGLEPGQTATLDFKNVNFNGKTITLKVPAGVTLSATSISSATTVTITNNALYSNSTDLQTGVEAATGLKTFYFTGDGSAIDLSGYTMTDTNSAVITVVFYGTVPTTPPSGTNWTWNAATKTATYTVPNPIP